MGPHASSLGGMTIIRCEFRCLGLLAPPYVLVKWREVPRVPYVLVKWRLCYWPSDFLGDTYTQPAPRVPTAPAL